MRNIASVLLALSVSTFGASPRFLVEPYAGSSWVGDGGPSRDSLLLQAEGLAAARDGSLYISDAQTHRIRRIAPDGIIQTVGGTGVSGLAGDEGPARQAQIAAPYGLALDTAGNLYVADLGNRRIRRIAADGTISTVATGFVSPRNVAVDLPGNVYVADFDAHRVYRITRSGDASVLVGPETLDHPAGLAVDRSGALYIGDTGHHTVWKWQNGTITKHADAQTPTGLALDAAGKLWIADPGGAAGTLLARDVAIAPSGIVFTTDGRLVRRTLTGITTVIAGRGDPARGDNGPAHEARLNNPSGLAMDAQGNLFIADRNNHRIRKVDAQGMITTVAGSGLPGNDGDGGLAISASLNQPTTLRFDTEGSLYVHDSANRRVRKIQSDGRIVAARSLPDAAPSTYIIDAAQRLARVEADGAVTLLELAAPIALPTAILPVGDTLYVADADQDRIWKLTPAPVPPDPVSLLRIPDRLAPGMIAIFEGYAFTDPEVVFDNIIATVLARTETSLAVLVPASPRPGNTELQLRDFGKAILRMSVTVTSAAPQLYAAVNEDGARNSVEAPAARGSILVIYGTGQGVEQLPVDVRMCGYAAEVLYSGSVPNYPGLWQLNVRIPGGFLPPGTYPLSVNVGGAASASLDVSII